VCNDAFNALQASTPVIELSHLSPASLSQDRNRSMATELTRAGMETSSESPVRVPREPLGRLFLRFSASAHWLGEVRLRRLPWSGRNLSRKSGGVRPGQFNRALAVYQVLPGPEAHELCVYFGMLEHKEHRRRFAINRVETFRGVPGSSRSL
jgi:hypothetical protein